MKVKKFSKDLPNFQMLEKGDWIDLYTNSGSISHNNLSDIEVSQGISNINDIISYNAGDVVTVRLGVAIELPNNHEAEIRPRSSTFKNTGLILTNSVGTIDESYKGDNDEWKAMFYATRDGYIKRFDRLLQFKVSTKMEKPAIEYVDSLNNENRGGYGSTGK